MHAAKITSKGQVTIPSIVRNSLGVEQGDTLIFEVSGQGEAIIRVIKRRKLSSLFGSFEATRPFPGKKEIRQVVGRDLGQRE